MGQGDILKGIYDRLRESIIQWKASDPKRRTYNMLAIETGISHSMLSLFINGKRDISGEKISRICQAIDLDPHTMMPSKFHLRITQQRGFKSPMRSQKGVVVPYTDMPIPESDYLTLDEYRAVLALRQYGLNPDKLLRDVCLKIMALPILPGQKEALIQTLNENYAEAIAALVKLIGAK